MYVCVMAVVVVTSSGWGLGCGRLWCSVDSQVRQDGCTKDMIFPIPTLVEVRGVDWPWPGE